MKELFLELHPATQVTVILACCFLTYLAYKFLDKFFND